MTIYETIHLERKGKVAILKINRSPLNLLNTPLLQEITEVLQSIKEDKGCRVLVLTGEGDRSFIGGADMEEMKDLNPETAKDVAKVEREANKIAKKSTKSKVKIIPLPNIAYQMIQHKYSKNLYKNALVQYILAHGFLIGWRPSELVIQKASDVFLEDGYIINAYINDDGEGNYWVWCDAYLDIGEIYYWTMLDFDGLEWYGSW